MNISLQNVPRDRQSQPQHSPAFPGLQRRPRVLIAEIDSQKRRNLKELLELYDIRVLETESGEDVIELALQMRPDLIMLNTELAELDGYGAARVIRNIKSLDQTPLIFLCAETDRIFRKRAFAVGGASFHIAPLDLERLDRILEDFLFHRR